MFHFSSLARTGFLLSISVMLAVSGLDVYFSYYPNFTWKSEYGSGGVVVGWRVTESTLPELEKGELVTELQLGDKWYSINELVLLPTLDLSTDIAQVTQSLAIEQQLFDSREGLIQFRTEDGVVFDTSLKKLGLLSQPLRFWLYRLIYMVSLAMALVSFFWRRAEDCNSFNAMNRLKYRHLLSILFSFSGLTVILPVTSVGRYWGLPEDFIWIRFLANMLVVFMNSVFFLLILLNNPRNVIEGIRLKSVFLLTIFFLYVLSMLLLMVKWAYSIELLQYSTSLLPIVASALIFAHWRKGQAEKSKGVDRVSISTVVLYSLCLALFYTVFNVLSKLVFPGSSVSAGMLYGVGGFLANGILFILVFRHHLFRLVDWWWLSYVVMAGSVAVVFFALGSSNSAWLSERLAIVCSALACLLSMFLAVGFQYRSMRNSELAMSRAAQFINSVRKKPGHHAYLYQDLDFVFMSVFGTRDMRVVSGGNGTDKVSIIQDGEGLSLGIINNATVALYYPENGMRLFTELDVKNAIVLKRILKQANEVERAFLDGCRTSRQRVAEDLRRNIGVRLSQLLTMGTVTVQQSAKSILSQLRNYSQALITGSQTLADVFSDVVFSFQRQCDAHGIVFLVRNEINHEVGSIRLNPVNTVRVKTILSELLQNTCDHTEGNRIELNVDCEPGYVTVRLKTNSALQNTDTGSVEVGLSSVLSGVSLLKERADWVVSSGGGVTVVVSFKLSDLLESK